MRSPKGGASSIFCAGLNRTSSPGAPSTATRGVSAGPEMQTAGEMAADYDGLAWCYERWWCDRFHQPLQHVLDALFYPCIGPPARVLDLCCGTGHLSRVLQARGYRVVGIDRSIDMLRAARDV